MWRRKTDERIFKYFIFWQTKGIKNDSNENYHPHPGSFIISDILNSDKSGWVQLWRISGEFQPIAWSHSFEAIWRLVNSLKILIVFYSFFPFSNWMRCDHFFKCRKTQTKKIIAIWIRLILWYHFYSFIIFWLLCSVWIFFFFSLLKFNETAGKFDVVPRLHKFQTTGTFDVCIWFTTILSRKNV